MALAIFFFSSKFISFKIKKVNKMQKELIKWYQQNKRDFPWRKDQDPYHIWISEIMLEQTTTETVIPYYERFLEKFSTIEALASASLEEVYKMWEGLGYYRRAKHLHESAQIIVEKYHFFSIYNIENV